MECFEQVKDCAFLIKMKNLEKQKTKNKTESSEQSQSVNRQLSSRDRPCTKNRFIKE